MERKYINISLSPEQFTAFQEWLNGRKASTYIRDKLIAGCVGDNWPAFRSEQGKYQRVPGKHKRSQSGE